LQTDELQQEFWVMKVVHSMALKVPVSIGLLNDSIVEVKSGMLQSGDKIITEGSYELADSSEITIQ
jgi:multidrug efflux pump subunit AcrA (membrane-fusion protein)